MALIDLDGSNDGNLIDLDAPVTKPPADTSGGLIASAKQSIGATIKGAGQAAADFIPGVDRDNAVSRYGQSIVDANPTAVQSLSDIADKPLTAVAEATGNAAGSMGGMLSARALGMGITAAAPLTGPFAPVTAAIGQAVSWLAPAAIASLPSFGSIRDQQILADPENEKSAKALAAATLGAGAVGAIETMFGPQQWALSAMTKEGRVALAEKFAKLGAGSVPAGIAKAAAFGGVVEGSEELAQNPIEQLASFQDPTTSENIQQTLFGGAMGAIGGGVIGGGFGAVFRAPDTDAAIRAASDAAFAQSTDATTAAIDEFKTGAMGPTGLLGAPSVGPALIAGEAGVGTPEQQAAFAAQQEQARLDSMTAPADQPAGLIGSVPIIGEPTVTPDTSGGRTDTTGVRADDLLIPDTAQPAAEPLVTPQPRVLSDIEAYQAAEQKQARGELLSSYERTILDAGPVATPSKLVAAPASTAEQGTAQRKLEREGSRPIPITQTQLAQQEQPALGPVPTTVGGINEAQLDNEQLTAIIANPATHANTRRAAQAVLGSRMTLPRGQAQPVPTQGAQNGRMQGQETPEEVAVKQVFGAGAQLRTASEAPQPGERVSIPMRAALTQIGRLTGTKVVFVSAEGADGATRSKDGNTVYVNLRSSINPLQVMGHETTHVLRKKHREAWAAIRSAVEANTDDAVLAEFARDYWSVAKPERITAMDTAEDLAAWLNQKPSDVGVASGEATVRDFLMDEMISDLGGNRWSDPAFWDNVFQRIEEKHGTDQAKGIIDRLVAAVKELIARFMMIAKRDGFAEFKTEGMIAQRVTPEQLREIQKAIENAYAGFISAERTNEPAGYVRGAAPARATGTQGAQGDDELAELEAQQSPRRVPGVNQTMPTRWPTAVDATPSTTDELLTDMATLRQDQKQYAKAVAAILQDPGMHSPDIATGTLDEKAEHVIERMKSNLLWLYDQIPEAIRERSKLWYDGARKISEAWAKRYDITESQAAGALAVLSPQKDWFMNVTMAERVLDIVHTKLDHVFDAKMDAAAFGFLTKESLKTDPDAQKNLKAYEAVKGKSLSDIATHNDLRQMSIWIRAYDEAYHDPKHAIVTPEGGFVEDKTTVKGEPTMRAWGDFNTPGKAASIYFNGSAENINKQLGREHKVRNFYNNIYAPKDPRFLTADTHAVAANELRPLAGADKPVAENFGKTGGTNVTGLSGTYAIHHEAYNRAAAERGVLPREMQSITWEAIRGLFTEGYKGKKENIAAIDAIWKQVDEGTLDVAEARAQILEHAGGITHPDWWNEGNAEYREVLRDKTYVQQRGAFGGAKVTFEVAPDPRNTELKGRWDALPVAAQNEISHKVAWKIAAKALASFGDENMKGELHQQQGGWMADTNPSLSIWFNKRAASTKIAEFARMLGFALNQQGMMRTSPRPFKASDGRMTKPAGVVYIDMPADADVKLIYEKIRGIVNAKGVPYVSGHTTSSEQMAIIHTDETKISTADLAKRIAAVLPDYEVGHNTIHVDFPEKGRNSYGLRGQKIPASESSLRARADQLRAEANVLIEQLVGEKRPDATGSRPAGESPASQSLPRYGRAADRHAVSVTGVHYSREQRQTLSSSFFGTGMKGQERLRVSYAEDPRIKRRLYFYANTGRGVQPESDVGIHAHAVGLDNVYDMDVDPLKLYVQPAEGQPYRSVDQRMNDFESAVLDAGYDGYMTREFGTGGAVVLLGDHSVPVQYEGAGARPTTDVTPVPRYNDLQQLRQKIAANRALPSGQMSGADWKRLLMAVMPEVDPRWLDNTAMYYKGDLLKGAEDAAPVQRSPQRRYSGTTPDDIIENPSPDRLLGALRKSTDKALRYVLDKDGNFYFWDAYLDNHPEGAASAGIEYDYTRRGGLYLNKDETAEFTNDFGVRDEELRRYMTGDTFVFHFAGHGVVTGDEARVILDDGGGVQRSEIRTQADAIKAMTEDQRDNLDPYEFGYRGYVLYEAEKMMPKKDGTFKSVTDNNSFMLWQEADAVVNVGGKPYLATKQDDPDDDADEGLYVWSFSDPALGGTGTDVQTDWSDKVEAVAQLREKLGGVVQRSTPRFYSQLARSVSDAPAKMDGQPASQWVAWINGNASKLGVKKEEIQWSGVLDWLGLRGKERTSREDVSGYLEQGGVQVETTVLRDGEPTWFVRERGRVVARGFETEEAAQDWAETYGGDEVEQNDERTGGVKFAEYVPPGSAGGYREVLLTLPSDNAYDKGELTAFQREMIDKYDSLNWRDSATDAERAKHDEIMRRFEQRKTQFRSNHWEQPNVIAHLRYDTVAGANGDRLMRVVEIQSDWGQKGKKEGFGTTTTVLPSKYQVFNEQGGSEGVFDTSAEADSHIENRDGKKPPWSKEPISTAAWYYVEVPVVSTKHGVPAAPFVTDTKSWTALAIKKAIMLAVEGDYDGIVFATGQQNADLYDLSKQIDKVNYRSVGPASAGVFHVVAIKGESGVWSDKNATLSVIEDTLGKEIAQKIKDGVGSNVKGLPDTKSLTGLDLKVGGEGMRAFYDQIAPQVANDVLKKLGAGVKVGEVSIRGEDTEFKKQADIHFPGKTASEIEDVLLSRGYMPSWMSNANKDAVERRDTARLMTPVVMQQPGFTLTDALRNITEVPLFSERRDITPDDIFTNPSTARLEALLRLSRDNTLRYVVDEDGDFHFWDAWLATHKAGADAAGVSYDYRRRGIVTTRDDMPAFSFWDDGLSLSDMKRYMTDGVLFPAPGQYDYATGAEIKNIMAAEDDALIGELSVQFSTSRKISDAELAADRAAEKAMRALDDFKSKHSGYFEFAHRTRYDGTPYPVDRILDREATRLHGIAIAANKVAADLVKLYQPARYSTPRHLIPQTWQDTSKLDAWDNLTRKLQDKLIDTKRIVAAIREAGIAIKDKFDPYLQETLFHGRAATAVGKFAEDELRPLYVEMQARGIKQADLDDYLWARHATERNAQIARINPSMPDGGSGLTNQQAADILAGRAVTLASGRTIQLQTSRMASHAALAARVDAITKRTTDLLVSSGLESQETIDKWRQTYGNYVPLMRDMEADDNYLGAMNLGMGTGQGFNVRGSASKRAQGSERDVVDILANVAMQRERAITRAEKNRVSTAVYGLALTAPNPEFWLPINPDSNNPALQQKVEDELVAMGLSRTDAAAIAKEPTQTYTDKNGMVAQRINPQLRGRDNVLALRVNGQDRYVFFSSDERAQQMVRNLKNLDNEQMGEIMSHVATVTRYFSSINTQFNPVFGLTNGIRDLGTGMLNLSSTSLKGQRKRVLAYAMSALRGVYSDLRDHRAGRQPTSRWALEFEEFQREGGQTGYRDMFATSKDRAEAIAKEIQNAGKGKSWVALDEKRSPIFGWLSDYNTSIENAIRLAAYKVAKEDGMTKERAAELAKNLTVNFNKKGLAATQAGAMYAFFNAAVQGTARIGATMVKRDTQTGKVGLTDAGKKIAYGGVMFGVMQALMLSLAGYDDEEPPQFIREKNIIIPMGYRGKYISLPMPLGFHVIPNLGRIPTEFILNGFRKPGDRLVQLFRVVGDAFNPIGSSTPLQMVTPTIVDPLAALAENKDWSGKSIYKEDFNKMEPTAGWTRKKDTSSDLSKWLSYSTNYITGGGKYGIGIASPTPDQIDYLIGQATGGVGRESLKLWQAAKTPLTGEELPMYKFPVLGRFAGNTSGQESQAAKLYDNLKRIGEHDSALKEIKRARDSQAYTAYMRENPDARQVKLADKASRDVSLLKRQKREALEKGDADRVRLIERQLESRIGYYNKLLSERKE